jgi:two-component system cell cycle response regulator DivK
MNGSTQKTVLVIEDNDKNMKLARDILEAKGYAVLAASNGEDGIRLAVEQLPDLVLMDIQMPGIDGIEALRQLRAKPSTAALPVAAFTASVTAADRSRVSEAGFDAFIGKPIKLKEFVATVEALSGDGT